MKTFKPIRMLPESLQKRFFKKFSNKSTKEKIFDVLAIILLIAFISVIAIEETSVFIFFLSCLITFLIAIFGKSRKNYKSIQGPWELIGTLLSEFSFKEFVSTTLIVYAYYIANVIFWYMNISTFINFPMSNFFFLTLAISLAALLMLRLLLESLSAIFIIAQNTGK